LFSVCCLEVEFFNAIAANNNDAGFFPMRSIDEHFVGHEILSMAPKSNP
jgi:hypothetical protein